MSDAVFGHADPVLLAEETKDLAGIRMSARGELRVQHLAINNDVENASRAVAETRLRDDVLIRREKIVYRAHGVT
jgi:hypothetical protein